MFTLPLMDMVEIVVGADGPDEALQMRLNAVFQEYPRLHDMYLKLRQFPYDKNEWSNAADGIEASRVEAGFNVLLIRDPDFVFKYKTAYAAAIADHPFIPVADKQDLIEIVFFGRVKEE